MFIVLFLLDVIWIILKFVIVVFVGFVLCVEFGIIILVFLWLFLFLWYVFIIISFVNLLWEFVEGCSVILFIFVIFVSFFDKLYIKEREFWVVFEDWYGCILVKFGSVVIFLFILGLYFIV